MLHPYCFIFWGIPKNILLFLADRLVAWCFILLRQKTDMIPGVNIGWKASVASVNEAVCSRGIGALRLLAKILGGSLLRKVLGSKVPLDWLKIDSNATKIITVWDYKCTKN